MSSANATGAHAEGYSTSANGFVSHSEGFYTEATGHYSHAEGSGTIAYGTATHSEGIATTASGLGAHAEGYNTSAAGTYAHAAGNSTIADLEGTSLLGIWGWAATGTNGVYGVSGNGGIYSWQLAGGSSAPSSPGQGIAVIARTALFGTPQPVGEIITNYFTAANADYAEYFEWADGNTGLEDRVGYFVSLAGDKIQKASNSDDCIGIASGTPCVSADSASMGWQEQMSRINWDVTLLNFVTSPMNSVLSRYGAVYTSNNTTDKATIIPDIITGNRPLLRTKLQKLFEKMTIRYKVPPTTLAGLTKADYKQFCGKYFGVTSIEQLVEAILSDLTIELSTVNPVNATILSDAYDPANQTYVPRSQRPEWSPVGMMGKLFVRDDGQCVVGSRCDCVNGIAVPGTRWPVLSRSDTDTIRILYWNR